MKNTAQQVMHCSCSAGVTCSDHIHFTQSVYNVTVNETVIPEHPRPQPGFITLHCTATHPPVTYTLQAPPSSSSSLPFEVDPVTGELNTTQDIDYDSQEVDFRMFSFNVSCYDTLSNNSTALVEVYVNPINEYKPMIDPEVLNITESTPSGTLLLSSLPGGLRRLSVSDGDRGIHGEVNFSLLTPLDSHLSFESRHANLTLVRAVDFETESNISSTFYQELPLNIRACDTTTPPEECPIGHFLLYILASDDNEPVFLNDTYTTAINESAPVGSTVAVLQCVDADIHIGMVQSIGMLCPPPEAEETFSLGDLSRNGSIPVILAKELDYDESYRSYQFEVSCQDTLHSTTANVSIHVLDVNDNVPTFVNPHPETVYVFEPTPAGPLHSVECRDGDEGRNGEIVYEILPQHNLFAVDEEGDILVNMPLQIPEFQVLQTHSLSVQCRDRGQPPLASNKTLTVVIDIVKPHITLSNTTLFPNTTVFLAENSPPGSNVLTLSLYDSPNTTVSIISQTLPGTFIISPVSIPTHHPHYHARLVVNGVIDREHIDRHYVELQTSQLSSSVIVEVIVQDVNDNAPNCKGNTVLAITAGYYSNTHLLSLSCSDADEGLNQRLTYQLEHVEPSLAIISFTVNSTSGELSVDGELNGGDYLLTVAVVDHGLPTLNTSLELLVEVAEEEEPTISRLTLILIIVVVVLVLVGVVSGCSLCCCYCYKVHAERQRKQYFIR